MTHVGPAPRVSVIIPTYNRADLLACALKSALAQTMTDFQVIVVDDGSTDDSAEGVVRAASDERVHYVRLPAHRGVAAARNVGVTRAVAPYIAFLDDDDEWVPRKLEIQTSALDESEPDVGGVYTARFTVDRGTGRVLVTRPGGAPFNPADGRNPITTSTLLIRRRCFDVAGLFDEHLETREDYDMWIRVSRMFRFDYIDDALARHYIHDRSISHDYGRWTGSMERLLEKHRGLFASNRAALCGRYVALGVCYCYDGKVGKAQRAFLTAIRIWPLEASAYINLGLSFLGAEGFKRAMAARSAWILARERFVGWSPRLFSSRTKRTPHS